LNFLFIILFFYLKALILSAKIQLFPILTIMHQFFRYFLTFVATLAILLPTLGFTVVKHTCNTCNTVEFHFFDRGNCSGCQISEIPENNSSCCDSESSNATCGIDGEDDSCCLVEVTEPNVDNFIRPVQVSEGFHLEPAEMQLISYENTGIEDNSSSIINYKDPPSTFLTGVDFLFFINQLKIPVC